MNYSFKKGFFKGLTSVLLAVISVVSVTAFADLNLWTLVETYGKEALSSVTVLGVLTMLLNYAKVKAAK